MIKIESTLKKQAASLKNMETQICQIASTIINLFQWTLLSNTEHTLENKGEEHYEAITLESGKESSEVVEKRTPLKFIEEENLVANKVKENGKGQEKNVQKEELTIECLTKNTKRHP